ncbi:MAG: hypothetical protein AB7H77_01635 [Bdellovibrionales bacterium]
MLVQANVMPAVAATPPTKIMVRAGVHGDFERIVFDWPRKVTYSIRRTGARVTIEFSASAQANTDDVTSARLARIRGFSATRGKNGHLLVSFAVDPQAGIKDFLSGTSIVIDIRSGSAAVTPAKKPILPQQPPSIVSPPQADQAPEAHISPPATAIDLVQPTSSSTEPALVAQPVLDDKKVAEQPPIPSASGDVTPPELPAEPDKSKIEEPSITPPPPTAPAADKTPVPEIGTASQLVVTLDPHVSAKTVVFQRAGYAYIVFDRKFTFDLPALTAGHPPPLVDLQPLDLPKASGWRFPVPMDAEIRAMRSQTAWRIFLSKQHLEIPVSTALVAQPDFALGARYLLPLADAPTPVFFNDPVVGDHLILVPLGKAEAFSVLRRMADFRILPAAQGLVIQPLNDKLVVRDVSDGIEITAEGGLKLSRAVDTGASLQSSQKAKAAAAGKSLFDFTAWRGKPNETFTETRQRLQQTIIDVPEAERNRARLELARFYFAHGNGEEASALLRYLALLVPDLATHSDFQILRGASKILAAQPEEGLAIFKEENITGQPEIELWQAVANAELRNWVDAEQKFAATETILAGYPEPFYSRFAVLAVESALATGKDREGKEWLDRLENGHHLTSVDPAIAYLHGVIHSKEGRAQAAEALWREVAESNDRLYRVRAQLALIDLDAATGAITPAKAADKLEVMRFGWRGDDLELDILHRLGQFYAQAKNIKAGLNVLNQAIQLYPKSPMAPQIRAEMAGIFRDVFLGDLAPDLSAVDALTLYQEYRELMPTGSDGDAVMSNLAERLVAIDLLDQAAGLLDELVKNRLKGVEKGRAGTRLAAIRLLDHKPEPALAALDMSNDNTYPADLLAERQLLRAKALSELGKSDDALELLKDSDGRDAKMLRADILVHAQRWNEAANELLELIGPPPKAGETLTARQADWLVSCAISLSLANDQARLGKLAIDFTASMAPMPQNDVFRVLTQPEKSTQLKDISAVQAKIADVDLFRGFLNAYRLDPNAPKAKTPAKPDENKKP